MLLNIVENIKMDEHQICVEVYMIMIKWIGDVVTVKKRIERK